MLDRGDLAIGEMVAVGICAGIFLCAGAVKLRDPGFARAIRSLTGLGPRPADLVARTVPTAELAVGIGLLLPPFTHAAGIVAVGLLGLFTVVLIAALLRGTAASCGCFGVRDPDPVSRLDVGRNLVLLAVLLPTALNDDPLPGLAGGPVEVSIVGTVAAALMVCGFVVLGNLRSIERTDSRIDTR